MFSLNNIALRPSRALLLVSSGVAVSVLYSLLITDISLLSKSLLLAFFAFYLLHHYPIYLSLRDPFSVVRIYWECSTGALRLRQLNGEWLVVERIYQRAVTPWLIVLVCSVQERLLPVTVVVAADSCKSDVFRRLQVCSRFAKVRNA